MNLDVKDDAKKQIENAITAPDSPVGIDAKKNSHNNYQQARRD